MEERRKYFTEKLSMFKQDEQLKEMTFDDNISSKDRRIVHELCNEVSLFSFSFGPTDKRVLKVTKEKIAREIEITEEHRKLFIKDSGLPIPIWKSPYFEYFIDLYKDIYSSVEKFNQFREAVTILENKNIHFPTYTYELINKICGKIKSLPAYSEFTKKTYIHEELPNNCNIYAVRDKNWPKYYISLDIIKANFSAMKFYSKELVLGCDSWEEFVTIFTDIKYFMNAKYFRQACLGSLKTGKMENVQLYLLSVLYNLIKHEFTVYGKVSSDEIIIVSSKEHIESDYSKLQNILDSLPAVMKGIWRMEPFSLHVLGESSVFIKRYFKKGLVSEILKTEIKNVERDFHAQAYKYLIGENVHSYDLKTMKDNQVISYDEHILF